MLTFPTNYLNIEGPDLAGKTTMFANLHEMTGYRWNIHDRSGVSMLVYAKLYGRDTFALVENLKSEFHNLNNRFLFMLPSLQTVLKRYGERGDNLHSIVSLKKTYRLFEEALSEFENYPNVMVAKAPDCEEFVIKNLINLEQTTMKSVAHQVAQLVNYTEDKEVIGVNFTLYDNGSFDSIDEKDLNYEKERDYYKRIRTTMLKTIKNELNGLNSYKRKEDEHSRRFIYADNSCIALAHFNYRKDYLDCHFVLRSSDVINTLYYDLNFLHSLTRDVYERLGLENIFCKIRFTINSAHILDTINEKENK